VKDNELIRHFLATIYYRGMKYFDKYKVDFTDFSINDSIRKPNQILNHINGLLLYIESLFSDVPNTYPELLSLPNEIKRFEINIKRIDIIIKTNKLEKYTFKRILQGPLADIMLHIGEISMLRKISGDPADDRENYIEAYISTGIF
jgi:hypothetical protein